MISRIIILGVVIGFLLNFVSIDSHNVVKAADMGPAFNPDSLAKVTDDPLMDSAYVYLQRPAVGGGVETRVDTLGIHPYYMNIIVAGGPQDPNYGTWIFTPTDPFASSHAHWYEGSGEIDKGLHSIHPDSVAGFWNPDYADYFNNFGAPDGDWETVTILNKNCGPAMMTFPCQ